MERSAHPQDRRRVRFPSKIARGDVVCDISFRFRRPASGDGDDGLSTVPCVHLKLRSALCIAYVQWQVGETVVFR